MMDFLQDVLSPYKNLILLLSTLAIASTSLLLIAIFRLAQILPTPTPASTTSTGAANKPPRRPPPSTTHPTHLLIVLGSGGHTAEMLNILTSLPTLSTTFTQRTYVVSSGDSFSAGKAAEFERDHVSSSQQQGTNNHGTYAIVTVRRARRVHQSFLSTPITTLLSLWDCISVLRGTHAGFDKAQGMKYGYPDLIITNGPGTGVCVVIAALLLRFFGSGKPAADVQSSRSGGQETKHTARDSMRTIFIESWARVKTLSLSGKILRPLVNRFLVQWPQLADALGEGIEYIGPLVS